MINIANYRRLIDRYVEKEMNRYKHAKVDIPCKRGCAHCCTKSVTCLPDEVEIISKLGIRIGMSTLELQYKEPNTADMSCVFLKDNQCKIYDNRPLSCRVHMVTTNPAFCLKGRPNIVRVRKADELMIRLYETHGRVTLHKALYHRLKDEL